MHIYVIATFHDCCSADINETGACIDIASHSGILIT